MKIKVHGSDIKISPKTEEMFQERLKFLEKYFIIDEADTANCAVKKVGKDVRVEITVTTRAGLCRSEAANADLETALDEAAKKLERQIINQKDRLNRRHKSSLAENFIEAQEEDDEKGTIPVRTKEVVARRMTLDEAILQMEMLGHNFFIYTDKDDDCVSVVYKRYSGGYGVIDVKEDQ